MSEGQFDNRKDAANGKKTIVFGQESKPNGSVLPAENKEADPVKKSSAPKPVEKR
jgi:hypothetical protein